MTVNEVMEAMGSQATTDDAVAMMQILAEKGISDLADISDEAFFALIPEAIERGNGNTLLKTHAIRKFLDAQEAFLGAAGEMTRLWQDLGGAEFSADYPSYLPSFDEFYQALIEWAHTSNERHPYTTVPSRVTDPVDDGSCDPLRGTRMDDADLGRNAEHDTNVAGHNAGCKYLGNDRWSCGHIDNSPFGLDEGDPPMIAADGSKAVGCHFCDRTFQTAAEADAHEEDIHTAHPIRRLHEIIAEIEKLAPEFDVALEGGGAGVEYIEIRLKPETLDLTHIIIWGTSNDTWGANIYLSQSDYEQGDCGPEDITSHVSVLSRKVKEIARDIVTRTRDYLKREALLKAVDETLADIVTSTESEQERQDLIPTYEQLKQALAYARQN